MTALQLAATAGGLLGLGLFLLGLYRTPARPDLAVALDRLAPERALAPPGPVTPGRVDPIDRVGLWAGRHLPMPTGRALERDLDLIGLTRHRLYGQKLLYAGLGLTLPVVLTAFLSVVGAVPPLAVPAIGGLLLAGVLSLIPDLNVRSEAATAREEFTRALVAYIDLVALERLAGAGPRQAMEAAAEIGDTWPFRRIAEELARSRWSGVPPWDALGGLADDLGLHSMGDLADVMRLSGEQGAAVYQSLRARSTAIRAALVTEDLAAANRAAERLTVPGAMLALTFAVLLTGPAVMRLVLG